MKNFRLIAFNPALWWYILLAKWFPNRVREIPEARDPEQILIRQFAIIKERAYLQQFACSENHNWHHSHPWKWGTIAIGLSGSVTDHKYGMKHLEKRYKAPYIRYMGPAHIHRTSDPSPNHTSIFLGLGPKTDEKYYYQNPPSNQRHWTKHIKKVVKRI